MPNALDNTNGFGECDEDMVNYTGILELFEVPRVFEISTENIITDGSIEPEDKNGTYNGITVNDDEKKTSQPEVVKRRGRKKKTKNKCNMKTTSKKIELNGHIEPMESERDEKQVEQKWSNHGWEDCLRKKPARAQPFQSTVPVMKRKRGIINSRLTIKKDKKKKIIPPENVETTDAPPQRQKREVGEIVWVRWRQVEWWPAIVMCCHKIGQEPLLPGQVYVFWLGENAYSTAQTSSNTMIDFVKNFNEKFSKAKKDLRYTRCVLETIHTCAIVAKHDISRYTNEEVLQWARDGFSTKSTKALPFSPDPDDPIPRNLKDKIKNLFGHQKDGETTEDVASSSNKSAPTATDPYRDEVILKVRQGKLDLKDICIACGKDDAVVKGHPLCYGGLCEQCENEVRNTMFAIGKDDRGAFCCICAKPGKLVICDNMECTRVTCSVCIETLAGPGKMAQIGNIDPWHCYLCTAYNENTHGLIHGHESHMENIVNFFRPNEYYREIPPGYFRNKKKIRVLSLFDGIGAGKVCLDRLGLDVEVYYASEICKDSMLVSSKNHPGKIVQLGPIEGIDLAKAKEIGPIDLVIGGSPCEELSKANPNRKGLSSDGTGELFFDFHRVLNTVRFANRDLAEMSPEGEERYVFFMYENVASMDLKLRDTISRFLECQPAIYNHGDFTAQKRLRLFWGNIPGMYREFMIKEFNKDIITLQSVLMPGCNRKAQMDFVRTITTRSNSLIQKKDEPYPVLMNGIPDVMWTTEIEMLFGFPVHYTDTGNLAPTKRKALVAKSWCIPVVVHIMQPLKTFFNVTTNVPESSASL